MKNFDPFSQMFLLGLISQPRAGCNRVVESDCDFCDLLAFTGSCC